MAHGNMSACLPITLGFEGGLSLDRNDPGNWTGGKVGAGTLEGTNMGIAASAHPNLDIVHLTKADAAAIYQRAYWGPAGCEELPIGLDLCHFDATVNSGRGSSSKWLKAAGDAEPRAAIHAYCAARLSSLESMRIWARFGHGLAVRVAGVEAKAVAMASAGPEAARTAIAGAAAQAGRTATIAGGAAHVAAGTAGIGIAIAPSHPALGLAAALLGLAGTLWSAFRSTTARTRAAVLGHAAQAT